MKDCTMHSKFVC